MFPLLLMQALYKNVLNFGTVPIDTAIEVFKLFDFYQVENLLAACRDQLPACLTPDNCYTVYTELRAVDDTLGKDAFNVLAR